jgi:hypothetical protein
MSNSLITAIWSNEDGDRYVWYNALWSEFEGKHHGMVDSGYMLVSIDSAEIGGQVVWSGVWRSGAVSQTLFHNLRFQDVQRINSELLSSGSALVLLRPYNDGTEIKYVGVWSASNQTSSFIEACTWATFWQNWIREYELGNRIVDLATIGVGGERLWSAVWKPGNGDQYLWIDLSWESFITKNAELSEDGFYLRIIDSYLVDNRRMWLGYWSESGLNSSLVADMTIDEFWKQWDDQLLTGRRITRLHSWPGTGFTQHTIPKFTLRIHFKILADPVIAISVMLDRMREIYEPIGFVIEVASIVRLDLLELIDLEVGRCEAQLVTDEQRLLFAERSSVGENEIVIYFVRTTIPPLNGCAAFPVGRPSAVITSYASQWTLAHEVGHVLGLSHVANSDRLMTSFGTGNITNPPPEIADDEVRTMFSSPFVKQTLN